MTSLNTLPNQSTATIDLRLRLMAIVHECGRNTPPPTVRDVRAMFWGERAPNVITNDQIRRAFITLLVRRHLADADAQQTGWPPPDRQTVAVAPGMRLVATPAGVDWMEGVRLQRIRRQAVARAALQMRDSHSDGHSDSHSDGQSIPTVAGPRVHHHMGEVYRPPSTQDLQRARPGCLDFLQAPSRMGDRLVYPAVAPAGAAP